MAVGLLAEADSGPAARLVRAAVAVPVALPVEWPALHARHRPLEHRAEAIARREGLPG
jgi:hypothetical protein